MLISVMIRRTGLIVESMQPQMCATAGSTPVQLPLSLLASPRPRQEESVEEAASLTEGRTTEKQGRTAVEAVARLVVAEHLTVPSAVTLPQARPPLQETLMSTGPMPTRSKIATVRIMAAQLVARVWMAARVLPIGTVRPQVSITSSVPKQAWGRSAARPLGCPLQPRPRLHGLELE